LREIRSFSFVCTAPCKKEAALLIYSIRRAGYQCPVLLVCDDVTANYLKQFKFPNVIIKAEANPEQLPKAAVTERNSFHKPDIILKKMDAMAWAIKECDNTMFLDADILILKDFDYEINQPTMLSPHYGKQKSSDKYGGFNAGYVYTEDPELPDRWKWLYLNRSRFYEQECMALLFESFSIGKFSKQHNIGIWRDGFHHELAMSIHQHFDPASYAHAFTRLKERYEARRMLWIKYLPDDILCFMRDIKIETKGNRWSDTNSDTIETTEPKDDWGNCEVIFSKSYSDGKFNLGHQPALKTHRGGWLKVLEAMQPLHNDSGVYCETFVESVFDWFRFKNEKHNHIPITEPWVGFIHNPHNMPDWYKPAWDGSGDKLFEESLESCIGIYTMSEYHAQGLRERYPGKTFESILHPYPDGDAGKWRGKANQLISVGWWLRKQSSIYTVQVPKGWTKIKLWPYKKDSKPIQYVNERLNLEVDQLNIQLPEIEHQYNLSNEDYDNLLCNSVVLLDLWDTSANNTVLECIQREVPIIVKDHPAVREYLGDDYPLYFNDLDEVHGLLDHTKEASSYLSKLRKSGRFTMEKFIKEISISDIYRQA
jgi:hypothetical protein